MSITADDNELQKLRQFYAIFSNYFKFWYCEACEVQFEHQISEKGELPHCILCETPAQPWIIAAAKEAKRDARTFEEKYNQIALEKEKIFKVFVGLQKICKEFGYNDAEETLPQFLKRKLTEYEALLDALPKELRMLTNNGKAKKDEEMPNTSSPHTVAGKPGS